ncbi:MAG: carbamate kinase [Christensenellaceae bacterium]|nr:carbamate kinase [Christensenellaceae bacterium]
MKKKVVIALGGNALGENLSEQMVAIRSTSKKIVELVKAGYQVVVTHGNGPQVGLVTDCFDTYKIDHDIDRFTMSVCVSITQGYIGYDLQNMLREELLNQGLNIPVSTVITQVIVDPDDPAFNEPTKPIGLYLNDEQAERRRKMGEVLVKFPKGWRQVVASPEPQHIVEIETIRVLMEAGQVVIACGGGGIPVQQIGNRLKGVEAIIDKDLTSAKLANLIDADYFVILTAVEKVALNYGKENEQWLSRLTLEEAQKYIDEGHFGKGSMLPKVIAAMRVVQARPQCKALITSLDKLMDGLEGKTGTVIVP